MRKRYILIDSEGTIWGEAELSPSRLNALLRDYERLEIFLEAREVLAA